MRGIPRLRPPYVAQVGIFDRPTLVHHVETLHWVVRICREGPEIVSTTEKNGRKGLRSYSVSGRVAQPGIYILPAGSTITDIIDAAGGMAEGHVFKAHFDKVRDAALNMLRFFNPCLAGIVHLAGWAVKRR